jgi:hypothetical protein
MKTYLFVLATVNLDDLKDGLGGISFQHAFTEAENADAAYLAGYKACGSPVALPGEVMNDYVVEISDGN